MERFTISLRPELAEAFDRFIQDRGYSNRSEAVRDLIRERLQAEHVLPERGGQCVATLSYVYNHHELSLAGRLTESYHAHHDISLSTMHAHLDHDHCLETVFLRGPVSAVRAFAEAVMALTGVRHGNLHLIPVAEDLEEHSHTGGRVDSKSDATHPHLHCTPET